MRKPGVLLASSCFKVSTPDTHRDEKSAAESEAMMPGNSGAAWLGLGVGVGVGVEVEVGLGLGVP